MRTTAKVLVLAMALSSVGSLSVAQTAQKRQFEVASSRGVEISGSMQDQKSRNETKAEVGSLPRLEVRDNVAIVTQQDKVLFKLPLTPPEKINARTATGREYDAERRDFAYLAGHCLLVQRGTVPGELYYSVDQGEVYNVFTQKKTVYPGNDARYWGGHTISTPSGKWAVMMREEEGMVYGYYVLGPDCSMASHKLEKTLFGVEPCGAGHGKPSSYGTEESIIFSFRENDGQRCYRAVVHPDGSNVMTEVGKE